jgi:hypothetical protein
MSGPSARGRLATHAPWRGRTKHLMGKPVGLSLPDLQGDAEPAAYLTARHPDGCARWASRPSSERSWATHPVP